MTAGSLYALTPYIILAAAAVLVMLVTAFCRSHGIAALLTMTGMTLSFLALPLAASTATRQVTALLCIDDFGLFYTGIILIAGFVVTLLSFAYFDTRGTRNEEYYILLICATLGAALMTVSTHFTSFFLALEILSVSVYAMIAYPRVQANALEAAVKYLILAAGSAAFMLFGMALLYAETGSMDFAQIAAVKNNLNESENLILLAGVALMVTGMGFKLALAPFHWWTADVYEGAPAPVTAFIATASKGAMFALLLRFFARIDMHTYPSLFLLFAIIAIASMFTGNLLALMQNNVKRILAYSSIAHLGYLMVSFLASGPLAAEAAAFYLISYFLTTLTAFGVVTLLSGSGREADSIDDYRGLMWRRPWLAGLFAVALFSLAGIPLTAGFVGKFFVLAAGENSARWISVILLVVNSAIGLYYYLRIIVAMCGSEPERVEWRSASAEPSPALLAGAAVSLAALALVLFGVYPAPLIRLLESAVTGAAVLP